MAKKGLLAIEDTLNDYSSDIQERITAEAKKIANNGAKTLKETSPKSKRNSSRKGKYAKGWRVKSVSGKGFVNCTIYNATDYQLTHLLENEHLTRNGGKYVPKKKHIQPVHDDCVSEFQSGVEKIVKEVG